MTGTDDNPLWTVTETLTLRDLVRYAGASGDLNPIHYDRDFAKSRGLPDVIVHGMLTLGMIARLVRAHAGRPVDIARVGAKFVGVVVPGTEITFSCYAKDGDMASGELVVDVRHTGAGSPSVIGEVSIASRASIPRPAAPDVEAAR